MLRLIVSVVSVVIFSFFLISDLIGRRKLFCFESQKMEVFQQLLHIVASTGSDQNGFFMVPKSN